MNLKQLIIKYRTEYDNISDHYGLKIDRFTYLSTYGTTEDRVLLVSCFDGYESVRIDDELSMVGDYNVELYLMLIDKAKLKVNELRMLELKLNLEKELQTKNLKKRVKI